MCRRGIAAARNLSVQLRQTRRSAQEPVGSAQIQTLLSDILMRCHVAFQLSDELLRLFGQRVVVEQFANLLRLGSQK